MSAVPGMSRALPLVDRTVAALRRRRDGASYATGVLLVGGAAPGVFLRYSPPPVTAASRAVAGPTWTTWPDGEPAAAPSTVRQNQEGAA